jgi:hypothetical protein
MDVAYATGPEAALKEAPFQPFALACEILTAIIGNENILGFWARLMRIAGTFLLLGGFFLCVSIVWAAIGFLMMGFGLICLLVAERRKARSAESTASRPDNFASRVEPSLLAERKEAHSSEVSGFDEIDPRREPSLFSEGSNGRSPGSRAARYDKVRSRRGRSLLLEPKQAKPALVLSEEQTSWRQSAIGPYSQEAEEWLSLVKNDPDISRSVAVVSPLGKKYVDELARAYLVLNDKEYLPIILRKIAAAAKRDSGKDVVSAASADRSPNTDLISFALSRTRGLREQAFEAQAIHDAATVKAESATSMPQAESDTKQKQIAVNSVLKSRGWPEDGTGGSGPDMEVEKGDARRSTRIIAPATQEAAIDDAEDLADLLNRLDLTAHTSARR